MALIDAYENLGDWPSADQIDPNPGIEYGTPYELVVREHFDFVAGVLGEQADYVHAAVIAAGLMGRVECVFIDPDLATATKYDRRTIAALYRVGLREALLYQKQGPESFGFIIQDEDGVQEPLDPREIQRQRKLLVRDQS